MILEVAVNVIPPSLATPDLEAYCPLKNAPLSPMTPFQRTQDHVLVSHSFLSSPAV